MTLRVDLYSPAGVKLDVPPLADTDILGCSYGLTLNAIGTFTLRIAAGCRAAVNATPGRQVWIYNEPTEGLCFKGIINDSEFTEDSSGVATFNLTGFSLGCQLNWKSTLIGRDYAAEQMADVVDDLLDDTAFTAGTISGGLVTMTMDGISIWEALSRIAAMFGAVLREDNINSEIDFVDVESRVVEGILDTAANGADEDAGTVSLASTTNSALDSTSDWAGIRFPDIVIPQGATITSAVLEVVPRANSLDEPDVTIFAELVADSGIFVASANNISNRTRTSASVAWSSTDLGALGTTYFSAPDLSTIIQEVVNQPTWEIGNALSILIRGSSDAARDLDFYLSFNSFQYPPKLTIAYSTSTDESGPTLVKFPAMPPVLTQDLLPITSFKKRDQGIGIINKIVAIAEMKSVGGDNRFFDLRNSQRTSPYAIQSATGPDTFAYSYVEDTASQAIYGVRERTIKFSGITTPRPGTSDESAADQLYEAAVSYLQQHSGTIQYYDAQTVGLQHYVDGEPSIQVGNLIRVQYAANIQDLDGVREYLTVDEQLYLTALTRTFDSAGADSWALQLATEPVPLQTRDSILSAIAAHAMDGSTIPLPRQLLSVGGDDAHTDFRLLGSGYFSWLQDVSGDRTCVVGIDKTVGAGLGSSVADTFVDGTPIHALYAVSCYNPATGADLGHIFANGPVATLRYAITTVTSAANGAATHPSICINASGGFDYNAHAATNTRFVGIAIVAYSD